MKIVRIILLLALSAPLASAYEAAKFGGLPPLIPLRKNRKMFVKKLGAFAGAGVAAATVAYFASGDKKKLAEEKEKLQLESNLLESEARKEFSDRSASIGEMGSLAMQSQAELQNIEISCSGVLADMKAVINNAMRLQNIRITKVMGSAHP